MAVDDAQNAEMRAYKFTVVAIVCVERAFKDLAGAGIRQGPKMRTADGTVVTPDMTVEAKKEAGGAGYRAVCEIKSSFPQHAAAVDQMVRQVRHYDGELAGWEHEAPPGGGRRSVHDIAMVVRHNSAPDFAAGLPAALRDREVKIKSPLSIIGIAHNNPGSKDGRFLLKRSFGTISHKRAHAALGKGWSIDARNMARELSRTKFYDSRPPRPYIMSVLWVQVFPNLAHGKKLKRLRSGAEVPIDAEVGRIHRLASMLAPPSNQGCVKRAWIKDAMEEFARVGLAERTGADRYRIRYAARASRPLEGLARLVAARANRADGPEGGSK